MEKRGEKVLGPEVTAVMQLLMRVGLTVVVSDQRPEGKEGVSHADIWENC